MSLLRTLLIAHALAAVAGVAHAQQDAPPPRTFDRASGPQVEARRSELPESVLRAERQTGGEVLRAESMQRDGREVYRLKVLTPDGRVRIMRDDPRERRRDAWRESRANALRDPFAEPPAASAFIDADRDSRREDRTRERREERFERFDAPPPSELDVPETLPPVERGDRD